MNVNNKKCIIIFSGFNQRAVVAFLRTIETEGIDYAIIAKSEEDDIFLTPYNKKILAVRDSIPLVLKDLLNAIEKIKTKCIASEYIIAPTTEALNRFLLEHREIFENNGCKIPLVDKKLYNLISDKYSFGQLCTEKKISIPPEVDIDSKFSFPVVAKPKKYYSSSVKGLILSPIIIKNNTEYELFKSKYDVEDFYYQEFIMGRSFYLLYYFHRNGEVYKFSQENLIQQPEGKSMIAAVSSDFHNSSESLKYEKLFKDLGYHGLVMVEVKEYNGENYMIEANPRFWGPSQLFVDADVNFFKAFLHDHGLIEFGYKYKEPECVIKYFWFGGMIAYLGDYKKIALHNYDLDSLFNSFAGFLSNDIYLRKDTSEIFTKEVFGDKGGR